MQNFHYENFSVTLEHRVDTAMKHERFGDY